MKPVAKICIDQEYGVFIRSITEKDIEFLRNLKNRNRQFFFYDKIISEEQQKKWYSEFKKRPHDLMFVVECEGNDIGCIGSRLFEGYIDIYNVILSDMAFKGTGIMKKSLYAVASLNRLFYEKLNIRVRVLKTNPAIGWYNKIGFEDILATEEYKLMQLNKEISDEKFKATLELDLPVYY